jgi:hypothetical protein
MLIPEPNTCVKNGSHTLGPTYYTGSYTMKHIDGLPKTDDLHSHRSFLVREQQSPQRENVLDIDDKYNLTKLFLGNKKKKKIVR